MHIGYCKVIEDLGFLAWQVGQVSGGIEIQEMVFDRKNSSICRGRPDYSSLSTMVVTWSVLNCQVQCQGVMDYWSQGVVFGTLLDHVRWPPPHCIQCAP
jgi:hypothetical protein